MQGPAGIGKTRLMAIARAEADRAGMRVLAARGSELEREFAYGLVRQLFEPALASEAERAKLLSGAAGQASALLGYADPNPVGDGDESFARLHGLFWLTANLCAQGPLLMVIDDLHWGDAPSLRFLTHLLPRLEGLPLLVIVGLRPAEPTADQHFQHLLTQIVTDPMAMLVRPAPLSEEGSAQLVRARLGDDAEQEFCVACHAATGGNPLFLHELASVAIAEGMAPSAAEAARLTELGSQAIGQRVALRLARLGPAAEDLCAAVAILGEDAHPVLAATIAGLEPTAALDVARSLAAIEILRPSPPLGFVHPLVRDAVYDGLPVAQRRDGHIRAARLLMEAGAASEQVAAHVLLIPPAGDSWIVTVLRRAAKEAFHRGSPEAAVAYLKRCLQEPPPLEQRVEILIQLGTIAQLVDLAKAAEHLRAALTLVAEPERRAQVGQMLGRVLHFAGRYEEAAEAYSRAAEALGECPADLRWQIQAGLLTVAISAPTLYRLTAERVPHEPEAHPAEGLGSRMLGCMLALHETFVGVPMETVVARARRNLADGMLLKQASSSAPFLGGCIVLISADLDEVIPLLDAALAEAHLRGSVSAFGILKSYRALALLSRGALAEAETNAREAMQAIATARVDVFRPLAAAFLADALMEQGRLEEAAAVLAGIDVPKPTPATGHWYRILDSHARLLMLQGRTQEGLEAMRSCGQCYELHGRNPALVAWRSGAALALLALDRREEARTLAAEELTLAERWGAPRALGHALWVAGLIEEGQRGLDLLHKATAVLASSPARLEHAKSLVELGAALRRSGQQGASREHLRRGLELAEVCDATPVVQRARTELRASGARLPRTAPSGIAALTPSERRVVDLALDGRSNQEIAQALYVTTKTVEAHLTRVYRKLHVTGRAGLSNLVTTALTAVFTTSTMLVPCVPYFQPSGFAG
jgi:DNA-binding CsgD family transcriptional regulator